MKKSLFSALYVTFACAATMLSCIGTDHAEITLTYPVDRTQTAFADQTAGGSFTFFARSAWTVSVDLPTATTTRASNVDWLAVKLNNRDTYSGESGEFNLSIDLKPNYTGATRQAVITVDCAGEQAMIAVKQQSITSSGQTLKPSVTVAAQSGELKAEATGSATFAVTASGIANGKVGTVAWFGDAAGKSTTTAPTGIAASVAKVSEGAASVTVTASAASVQGTYWFKVTIDGVTSPVATLSVGTPAVIPLVFTDNSAFDIPASTTGTPIITKDVSGGVTGGRKPYTFSANGLPEGVAINPATGVISGTPATPAAAGTATVTVADSSLPQPQTKNITIAYGSVAATYIISVSTLNSFGSALEGYTTLPAAQAVIINNTGTGSLTLDQPTATSYTIGTLSATTLVPGAMATFTVQPKAGLTAKTYSETISIKRTGVTAAIATVTTQFTVTVPPLVFADDPKFDIPASTADTPIAGIDLSAGVSGGKKPYVYSTAGLPTGLSINTASGIISGTPTTPGEGGSTTVTVKDSSSPQLTKTITIAYGAISAATSITVVVPGGGSTR